MCVRGCVPPACVCSCIQFTLLSRTRLVAVDVNHAWFALRRVRPMAYMLCLHVHRRAMLILQARTVPCVYQGLAYAAPLGWKPLPRVHGQVFGRFAAEHLRPRLQSIPDRLSPWVASSVPIAAPPSVTFFGSFAPPPSPASVPAARPSADWRVARRAPGTERPSVVCRVERRVDGPDAASGARTACRLREFPALACDARSCSCIRVRPTATRRAVARASDRVGATCAA